MKQRVPKIKKKTKAVSMRLEEPIANRLERVVVTSQRSWTSILEECIESHLPKQEKRYKLAA